MKSAVFNAHAVGCTMSALSFFKCYSQFYRYAAECYMMFFAMTAWPHRNAAAVAEKG